jgi:hypothetical protein
MRHILLRSRHMVLAAVTVAVATPVGAQSVPDTRITRDQLRDAPLLQLADPLLLAAGRTADSTSQVVSVTADRSGMTYLLDDGRKQVRVIDALGREVRSFGSEGTGDGQFRQPVGLAVARDSILILDVTVRDRSRAMVLHVYDADGTFRATVTQPRTPGRQLYGKFRGTDSGWVLGQVQQEPPRGGAFQGPFADTMFIAALAPAAFGISTLAAFADTSRFIAEGLLLRRLLEHQPTFAVASDGRIYTNADGGFVVVVHSRDGAVERRIIAEVDRIPVTDGELQESIDQRARSAVNRGSADAFRQHLLRVGRAAFRPVIGRMHASHGGRVLVERLDAQSVSGSDEHRRVWHLIDVEAGLIGNLAVPSDVNVVEFAWPHVYMRLDGIHGGSVMRYRIVSDVNDEP